MSEDHRVIGRWYLSLVLVMIRKIKSISDEDICARSGLSGKTIAGLESFDERVFDSPQFYSDLAKLCKALDARTSGVLRIAERFEQEARIVPSTKRLMLGRMGFTPELLSRAEAFIRENADRLDS